MKKSGSTFDSCQRHMLETFNNMPIHPMVLHAPIVLIPLLALVAVIYAFKANWRDRMGWAVISLAVLTVLSAAVTGFSGLAMRDGMRDRGLNDQALQGINSHGALGLWLSLVVVWLTLASFGMVLAVRGGRYKEKPTAFNILRMVVLLFAIAAVVLMFLTADAGGRLVWGS